MKYMWLFPMLLLVHAGEAATRASFFGVGAMVQIWPQNPGGPADSDSFDIYRAMNVPVQDSIIGPGKAIQTSDRALSFQCAIRNNVSYECSIVFNRSANLKLDIVNKKIKYEVTGIMAEDLRQKFFLKDDVFHFKSTDALMSVDAIEGRFTILYSAQGI
jgi:hypothetical protein